MLHEKAYEAIKSESTAEEGKRKRSGDDVEKARAWMCQNFYDIRTFGAVMSLATNCGQFRGPIQLSFSRSVDPIVISEHAITRMAVATEREATAQQGDSRTMGRKFNDYANRIKFDGQPLDDFIKPGESKDLGTGITLIRRI